MIVANFFYKFCSSFSTAADCLLWHGYQITLPYSKCGQTKALHRETKILLFKNVNVLFIIPKVWLVLFTALSMQFLNKRLESMIGNKDSINQSKNHQNSSDQKESEFKESKKSYWKQRLS